MDGRGKITTGAMTSSRMAVAVSVPPEATAPREETLEDLFESLEGPLLGYARRLVPDSDVAEDLVQDAFVKLHAQRGAVRAPRRWLYRTVHNLALNHRRDVSKVIPLNPHGEGSDPVLETPDPGPNPDEQCARDEGAGLVRQNLRNLDARSQELIRLKFTESMSYQQISERTGLSVGNVGYILHHTLKSLAAELARAGFVS